MMASAQLSKLSAAWSAAHLADQLLLAWIPLYLVASGASPATVGGVLAAHAAAWLIVSMPVGACADFVPRRQIIVLGSAVIIGSALLGLIASSSRTLPATAIGLISFLVAGGVVAIVLAVFTLVPKVVEPLHLPRTNAALEFARALASILAPLIAATLIASNAPAVVFAVVAVAGIVALAAALRLPVETSSQSVSVALGQSMRDGAAFVINTPLLRAILLCAIAWNSAFFALTAVFASYATQQLDMGVPEIGMAWSVYGAGLLLGAVVAPRMIAWLPISGMFLFGPLLSCGGVALMVLMSSADATSTVWIAFFCLGFGPMTWLVLQTSVRQIVTPRFLMGRVGGVITTSIYGARPLGALAAGAVASTFGISSALWMTIGLFLISVLAIVLSPAVHLRELPKAAAG